MISSSTKRFWSRQGVQVLAGCRHQSERNLRWRRYYTGVLPLVPEGAARLLRRLKMSYDVQVWSVDFPSLPSHLPNSAEWVGGRSTWTYSGRVWEIAVGSPDCALPEDVPEEVQAVLPGIQFRTEFNLTPFNAGGEALRRLTGAAKHLAKMSRGVVLDPQNETVSLPSGVVRLSPLGQATDTSLLTMKWCSWKAR